MVFGLIKLGKAGIAHLTTKDLDDRGLNIEDSSGSLKLEDRK